MQDGLRDDIPPPPTHMASRPLHRGYPVPYFVGWVDGLPEFRVADRHKHEMCRMHEFCWCCGKPLGTHRVLVTGPMALLTKITAEPPSHRACAEYALQACPHLVHPHAKRREAGMPEKRSSPAGTLVTTNPGVALAWEGDYEFVKRQDGWLIELKEPVVLDWWTRGRRATREEALAGLEASVSRVKQLSIEQFHHRRRGLADAMHDLGLHHAQALELLPE